MFFSDCTQLGLQTHGNISTTNVFHGTTVTVTCEKNYSLINGTSKHTCTDGLWSGKMGQCRRGEANYNSFGLDILTAYNTRSFRPKYASFAFFLMCNFGPESFRGYYMGATLILQTNIKTSK